MPTIDLRYGKSPMSLICPISLISAGYNGKWAAKYFGLKEVSSFNCSILTGSYKVFAGTIYNGPSYCLYIVRKPTLFQRTKVEIKTINVNIK